MSSLDKPVFVRRSNEYDSRAIAHLAAVSGKPGAPAGRYLIAEIDDAIVAAVPLDDSSGPLSDQPGYDPLLQAAERSVARVDRSHDSADTLGRQSPAPRGAYSGAESGVGASGAECVRRRCHASAGCSRRSAPMTTR